MCPPPLSRVQGTPATGTAWRRPCRGCSPRATCAAVRSSAAPPRWVRVPWPCRWSTSTWPRRRDESASPGPVDGARGLSRRPAGHAGSDVARSCPTDLLARLLPPVRSERGAGGAGTVFLSLDTTAVLLTPIVVTLARRIRLSPLPFALTTVWLANSASLLLPVSNLTNLLAQSSPVLADVRYVSLSAVPALVAVVVPVAILALVYRRALAHRYVPSPGTPASDPALRLAGVVVVALLVPALGIGDAVLGIPVWIPATAAAVVLVLLFALRRPTALHPGLVPWSLIVFVCGLFLAITAAGRLGLTAALDLAAGQGEGPLALLRLAGVGTVAANVGDNLPAYLAMDPVAGSPVRLMALLVAVNAGPLVLPWASLATLLWHGRLTAMGVEISWGRFALLGLIAAPLTVAAATLAL